MNAFILSLLVFCSPFALAGKYKYGFSEPPGPSESFYRPKPYYHYGHPSPTSYTYGQWHPVSPSYGRYYSSDAYPRTYYQGSCQSGTCGQWQPARRSSRICPDCGGILSSDEESSCQDEESSCQDEESSCQDEESSCQKNACVQPPPKKRPVLKKPQAVVPVGIPRAPRPPLSTEENDFEIRWTTYKQAHKQLTEAPNGRLLVLLTSSSCQNCKVIEALLAESKEWLEFDSTVLRAVVVEDKEPETSKAIFEAASISGSSFPTLVAFGFDKTKNLSFQGVEEIRRAPEILSRY